MSGYKGTFHPAPRQGVGSVTREEHLAKVVDTRMPITELLGIGVYEVQVIERQDSYD